MRQIEVDMLKALRQGRTMYGKNTVVDNEGNVTLFGNVIWKKIKGVQCFTFAGWRSTTTKSRINALLSNTNHWVTQKDYQLLFDGKKLINASDWYNAETGEGVKEAYR